MNPTPPFADLRTRFLLPEAGVRGVSVHLRKAWADLCEPSDYPPNARELLGQAVAASALFTGHVKIDGRLSVQLRSSVGLRTLFAECTAAGTVRGIVQLLEGEDAPRDLSALGGDALLAITIENPGLDPREPQRYQSLVELSASTLDAAFQDYFLQSEQLPTRLLLAADGDQIAGIMLQKLPGDEGDSDGWQRAGMLFDTLGRDELLNTPQDELLHRLFHQEDVSLLDTQPLRFGCSCSRERVESMLASLGREEAMAAADSGQAEIRCEFCGRSYHFSPEEISRLFDGAPLMASGSERLQ
ncbi:MAG: Hsp33 family molecular chaperone HslO [Pseudoxanthomonas sp.]|nr:Hsp33 family molecular chaperone HslO [Pseudoxanthomonas sp.]WDS37564.1 MAG: Hsp33 family molecular chaperone HslO [Pseudoxanthomonas sp.]